MTLPRFMALLKNFLFATNSSNVNLNKFVCKSSVFLIYKKMTVKANYLCDSAFWWNETIKKAMKPINLTKNEQNCENAPKEKNMKKLQKQSFMV